MLHPKEKSEKVVRGVKTLFFLVYMVISFLLFSAPLFIAMADTLLPMLILSTSLSSPPRTLQTLFHYLDTYDFRCSVVDIPLISIARSAVVMCVYAVCDGPALCRFPYLLITILSSATSLLFLSVKASYVFGVGSCDPAVAALFMTSAVLAVGHVVVAYRTSCRERRKLLIYKIDIEAVSACKYGFPVQRYLKIHPQKRGNEQRKSGHPDL